MDETIKSIYKDVIKGDSAGAGKGVQSALDAGIIAEDILKQGLIPAMQEVGERFEKGEYFVPEMLVAARAMENSLGLLKPLLASAEVQSTGKVVLGTVQGDLHDIGKNLVGMMLEGAGFEIVDLGSDVPPDRFAQAVREDQPDILAMSALLTTTMPAMKTTIEALEEAGLRGQVKVMVGGAPITEEYANGIGADGFAPDASRASTLARKFVE